VVLLPVKEKDFVVKGQRIAVLRADDNRAALSSAEARVVQDEADIRLYQAEAERQGSLWQQHVGTRQAFDRSQRDLESAQARRNTDKQEVRRMKALVAKAVIFAPISGVVTSRIVQPGEIVKEGASLISLADLRRTRIEAEVDEFDAGRVQLGQKVEITAEGYDGQRWHGRVEEIPDTVERRQIKPQDPAAPTDTRVLLVKIALLEKTPLKLNQRVQVAVKTGP
jgi:RND family efflux transporter MFP subunit